MMFSRITRIVVIIAAILLLNSHAWGRILILHSYHDEYDWTQGINAGLKAHLSDRVDHRYHYMDTKRRPDEKWKQKAAREARKVIKEYKPKVIIATDDNAQKYVVSAYAGRNDIQIVFCGVNADPEAYGYPSTNVTGILERAYPDQVFQLLKKISPEIKRVTWISDDSPTAQGLLPRMRKLAENNLLSIQIANYKMPSTFGQWKEAIAAYDRNPETHALLIPLYHTVKKTQNGNSVQPSKVMEWTVKNTQKPIVGFWPFSTDDGALCTVAVDPYEHGKVAAIMAMQIIGGKKASQIPVVTNQNGYVIVNLKSAERLKINVPFAVIQSADRIIQ